jgi:hypothetical protein
MQEEKLSPILKRLLLAIHLGMLPATVALSASAIDFKGIPLGISLEDFRAIQHPDGIQNTNVICSNDEDLNSYQAYPFKGGGGIVCSRRRAVCLWRRARSRHYVLRHNSPEHW